MSLLLLALACGGETPPAADPRVDAELHPALVAQSRLFAQQVLNPVEGVHVAIGYGLANVVMLEGPDGVVIVDTTEGRGPATEALAALRAICDKPIKAIVLSHNHADHVFGGQVFVDAAVPGVAVWAQEGTEAQIDRIVSVLRGAIEVRSARMFGSLLPEDRGVGDGIGYRLRFRPEDIALARPTRTYGEEAQIEAGGLHLTLLHVPGETEDQTAVWWPERGVLLPGDDVYQAFPNLYTIRGTPWRDLDDWVDSLDRMRDLGATVLVPQHTQPVVGAEAVEDVLVHYRDAIQYVNDQTIRGMNAGRTPDQLAAEIHLPAHLAAHPWLAEHYGRVPWSVRAVYAGNLGWFDGRGADLEPLPPDERARRYATAFAEGVPLGEQATRALDAGEAAWAAELGQLWVDAEPEDAEAKALLARALEAMGRGHINANARNWYLTEAMELRGDASIEPTGPGAAPEALIDGLPIDVFMRAMPPRLRAEEVLEVDWQAVFEFTDLGRAWVMHVRRGVAEVRERPVEVAAEIPAALRLRTTTRTWKRIVVGQDHAVAAVARGELEGDLIELAKLQRWFER